MTKTDSIAARLVELAAECLQLAATLKKQAEDSASPADELLTVSRVQDHYGMGRVALDSRRIPKARDGRPYKWRVSYIAKSITAEPPKPRLRRYSDAAVEDEDQIDNLLRTGVLVRGSK